MGEARLLKPEEAERYCALRRAMLVDAPHAFLGAPGDDRASNPENIAAQLREPENEMIVVDDPDDPARVIASAGLVRSRDPRMNHRALIWTVYCDPAHRRRGYARAVMRKAIETARSWDGVEILGLAVSAKSGGARALYQSLGFVAWGVEPDVVRIDGVGYDEVHMALGIRSALVGGEEGPRDLGIKGSSEGAPAFGRASASGVARVLRPEDAAAYCTLRRVMMEDAPHAFLVEDFDPERVASRLGPEHVMVGVDDPDDPARLVAVAVVSRMGRLKMRHRAMIYSVYCDVAHRRRGYARAVMERAIETARSWAGVDYLSLAVSSGSAPAQALYESLGFVRWGVEPDVVRLNGAAFDDIHMTLRL